MDLTIVDDYEALSREAADLAALLVSVDPSAAIVVATGHSPMGMYQELAERRQRGELDTSQLRIFQLDEYLGIGPDDPRSLFSWMERSFLTPLGIAASQVMRLPGDAEHPEVVCRAYDQAVQAAGGFDLAILGLGPNGHLGFNEPPSYPDAPTRVVALAPESVASNRRYFGGEHEIPARALTAGMATLLGAKRTLLLVSGERKRDILRRTVEGPQTPGIPASYLQRASKVTVIADRAAAGSLQAAR
ncbi:MAG TPA: glucosamine-6-phosphate deaminase [Chloroflexota bacterium]